MDDVSEAPPGSKKQGRIPHGYVPQSSPALPYLNRMLSEPEIDFVPTAPSSTLDPHAVWESMMTQPAPSPAETRAIQMRNTGIALLSIGTVLMIIAVPVLAARHESHAAQGVGYTALTLSLLSLGGGGALYGIGEQRLRRARRSAAGLALGIAPHTGFGLAWAAAF